ncbi:MAG TPA: hypothetical protein VK706_02205 [Candidatus Sulfotelmatobacter sp.]|jgi:hypothetical protein|nr:hypothetical protein [Candidatus Sulfotelmatobacter sp.]
MNATANRVLTIALCTASVAGLCLVPSGYAAASGRQTQQAPGTATASRRIGAIKTINGTVITLTPDSGPDLSVTLQATTRILRIAPGEKDLKNATPIQLQDLQVGDRVLVAGKASDDNLSLAASTVVVMKHSDLEARHQQDIQDWQKRGVDGLAKAVDPAAGTVTISVRSKDVIIHSSNTTVIRRYAPDSVKFDDAKPGTLQQIHSGDQVRARGDRSADGSELSAEEIVSGSFPGIAGTVESVDASSSTLSVHDLLSKKTVVIKITPDSQLRHLPPEMAQMIAVRLKGGGAGATPGGESGSASTANGQTAHPASPPGGTAAGGTGTAGNGGGSGRSGGPPDVQRLLSRAPAAALTDLHKGDAVIILSTEGTASVGTVITLVSGVEPILQAAPSASSAALLTPWSMGAPSGDAGGP